MLLTYLARVREGMVDAVRHNQLMYQVRMVFGGKEEPPAIPDLLKDEDEQ